jgi:hypothetical protein
MKPAPKPLTWRPSTLLALSAAAIAAVAWFALRAAASSTDLSLAFIGWLAFLFLAATVTVVVGSASRIGAWRRTLFAAILLTVGLSAVILCVGVGNKIVTVPDVLRLSLILAAWLALWSCTSLLLSRISPAFSVATSATLAMFFFAGPVSALPFLRAASPGSTAQRTIVQSIAAMTPMLAALDAVKGSVLIEWAQLPQMYHLTTAGQDIAMPLPPWWTSALLYASLALACAGASRLRRQPRMGRS